MATDRNELDAQTYGRMAGFGGDWRDCWWNQDYLELMAQRIGLGSRRRLLDVGCGVGHWGQRLLQLAPRDATLHSIDREPAFLDQARARAQARGLASRCTWQHGAAEQLPFASDHFELVTCQTVLMHVEDAKTALREFLRVLAPGGVLLVAEPDNFVNAVSPDRGPRPAALPVALAALELQQVAARGKRALGHGDENIGSKLFGLFHELGLERVRSWTNDRAAALAPPYEDPCQQRDLAVLQVDPLADRELRARRRRHWVAGGGDPLRFDTLWQTWWDWVCEVRQDVEQQRFVRGGGFLMYVCVGEKPAAS